MDNILVTLRDYIQKSSHGDRLPTIRSLMHEYGVSQKFIENCLEELKAEGSIKSFVGRGTYVVKDGPALFSQSKRASVLLLTRNIGSARSRLVLSRLQDKFSNNNIEAIQITYNSEATAIHTVRSLQRVDLCIVQCHFEPMSIDLISALRKKAKSIMFDGGSIVGIDVDTISSDWRAALDLAIKQLADLGHKHIGMIGSDWDSRPISSLRQHYESLHRLKPWGVELQEGVWLPDLPSEGSLDVVAEVVTKFTKQQPEQCTALMIWGAIDGNKLIISLKKRGIKVPDDVSVILLGHQNVATESAGFFTVVGADAYESADDLFQGALKRIAQPFAPPTHQLHPVGMTLGASVKAI